MKYAAINNKKITAIVMGVLLPFLFIKKFWVVEIYKFLLFSMRKLLFSFNIKHQ